MSGECALPRSARRSGDTARRGARGKPQTFAESAGTTPPVVALHGTGHLQHEETLVPKRTTLTTVGASLWAVLGGSVSLAELTSVNDDAVLLVGLFSILGPALAVAAAVAAARGSLRNSGLLLVMSALATPTYFAYPLKVVALGAGLWLAVTARSTAQGRGRPEPA